MATPLALSIDNVDLAGNGALEAYGFEDFTILEMRPTEKEHSDSIITVASIGLESRFDISRSFFVQNVQFIGLKEPALQDTVLEIIGVAAGTSLRPGRAQHQASTADDAKNRYVPLVQEPVSTGARQVAQKVWNHFRAFGGIERVVVQQTGIAEGGGGGDEAQSSQLPVYTAHAIVTMASPESFERALVHHRLGTEQKPLKAVEFGAGPMGIEVQYRPTFRNLGNVALIRFVRGEDGVPGQAEAGGVLTPGDLLVGVGNADVRGKDLRTVRELIKDHGRPLTLYVFFSRRVFVVLLLLLLSSSSSSLLLLLLLFCLTRT